MDNMAIPYILERSHCLAVLDMVLTETETDVIEGKDNIIRHVKREW